MDNQADKVETNFKYTANPGTIVKTSPVVSPMTEEAASQSNTVESNEEPLFSWSAPDSFSTIKGFKWYLNLIIVTVIVSATVYLITKDKITTSVFVVSGLLLGIYASKKPRIVNYQLTRYGFRINGKSYEFGNYRSFSVVHHDNSLSAVLTPLKRFMPYMYIYFSGDMEKQITSTLGDVLPIEVTHRDLIDKITRKIGF